MKKRQHKGFFSLFLSLSLFTSSIQAGVVDVTGKGLISIARVGNLPTREFSQLGVMSSKKLAEAGVARVEVATTQQQIAMIFMDSSGREMKRFFVNRSTTQQLEPFRPSKFREWGNKLKTNSGAIALAKAKHFPIEATSFFVAIGALTVYDLIFNYASNPLVAQQFLESQKDPITHISFLAFMQANGLAVEPLMEMVEKPWLRKYIPYMGMAVGMAASQLVHGVGHSELLKSCASSLLSKNQKESAKQCDEAWSNFGTGWGPVVSEFSTGLVVMFMSSVFAAAGSWAASVISYKVIQLMGMELASFALPGGGVGRAIRFILHTGKNFHFLAWDTYLRAPVDNFFTNSGSNQIIERLSECLDAHHSAMKRNKWNENPSFSSDERFSIRHFCDGNFVESSRKFFDLYRSWRSANLKDYVLAQQNWFQYLSTLTSHYRSTQSFYQVMTDKVYKKYFRSKDPGESPLDQSLPLFGVATAIGGELDWGPYLEYPKDLEKEQIQVVNQVASQMLEDKKMPDGLFQALTSKEKRIFDEIQTSLSSQDPKIIGKGLDQIARIYDRSKFETSQKVQHLSARHEYLTTDTFKNGFKEILKLIGEPIPQWNPGQGFMEAWMKVEGLTAEFPKRLKNLNTASVPEYLVASMAWGPKAASGEKVIGGLGFSGFQAQFYPPRIFQGNEVHRLGAIGASDTIFNQKIWIDSGSNCSSSDRSCYHPLYNWLRGGHLRSDIITSEGNRFSSWWNQYVEPQYLNAWKDFERKYESNVQGLANHLFSEKNHYANSTKIPNSPMLALDQERSVALYIINSLFLSENGPDTQKPSSRPKFNILTAADKQRFTEFSALQIYNQEWLKTRDLFKNLQQPLKKSAAGRYFVSRVSDAELKDAKIRLDEKLNAVLAELQPRLKNESSYGIARIMTESLLGSHQEILDYGLMVNSASYVENHLGDPARKRCMGQLATPTGSSNHFRGLDNNRDCQNTPNQQELTERPN